MTAFETPAEAAWALLSAHRDGQARLSRKAGSFAGETLVDEKDLSERQEAWIQALLAKAQLPPLNQTEARDG